jgi:hypothetical protein
LQAQRVNAAYGTHLRQLQPKAAAAEFHNVGAALFFSLSPHDKEALIQELAKDGLADPYIQELRSEPQDTVHLQLDKNQSPAQKYMQSCLFKLLVLEKDTLDIEPFAFLPVIDQLRILYFLYRIFYHTEFTLDIQNDHSIQQLLDRLPQRICQDIATKATTPTTYERCCILIQDYIKPADSDDPAVLIPIFFALYENDLSGEEALKAFSRLTTQCQDVVLQRLEAEDQAIRQAYSYKRWRSYERQHPISYHVKVAAD